MEGFEASGKSSPWLKKQGSTRRGNTPNSRQKTLHHKQGTSLVSPTSVVRFPISLVLLVATCYGFIFMVGSVLFFNK